MKNLFQILPMDFFKPLTSKYRKIYADCIIIMFQAFKSELSYGIERTILLKTLETYFEDDDEEMILEDNTALKSSHDKANGVILAFKNCGWIEYEQERNHIINVVLYDYCVPIIESMVRIIKEEESEYQGIITQIHAALQNKELYKKPYEYIIKGVIENSEKLLSELKRLNVGIKHHIDKLTNDKTPDVIIKMFLDYHNQNVSKAYFRMKTSENISMFRNAIVDKISEIMKNKKIMAKCLEGFMQVEQIEDEDVAKEELEHQLASVKARFNKLDDIIKEIDRKNALYMQTSINRARFMMASGNNTEGKISQFLAALAQEINMGALELEPNFLDLVSIYHQNYFSQESLQTIPVEKEAGIIDVMDIQEVMSEAQREQYKQRLKIQNKLRFTRKNINDFVMELLKDKEKISVKDIPITCRKDVIRIIYISVYANNRANNYDVIRSNERMQALGFEYPVFDIIRR